MSMLRRKTRKIKAGSVRIGGSAPISVQSMAKTDTRDVEATVSQIKRMEHAGCELVRVAVKDIDAARALADIRKGIRVPLVADMHFSPKLALLAIESGADKIRINPGNMTDKQGLVQVAKLAKKKRVPIRIGLNSGSVPKSEDMVSLARKTIKLFERNGFYDIIISLKSSNVNETVRAYRKMAEICDYPLHLGMTATGLPESGIVKSSIAIGTLLLEGIGDTVRVSLTGDPLEEIRAARIMLSSLGIRDFGPEIISCPTCGRCQVDLRKIVGELNRKLSAKHYPLNAKRPLSIAVMGCEVNGPGEARDADIGIAAGKKSGVLFKKGKIIKKIKEKDFVKEILGNTHNAIRGTKR